MSGVKVSDAQKIEILYNKALGAATSAVGAGFSSLPSASAATKIIPSLQIFSDPIPATAGLIDDLVQDMTFSQTLNPSTEQTAASAVCRRLRSTKYPHMVKYENFQVVMEQDQESYKGTIGGVNYLAQTIPFNYDSLGSYNITVKTHSGTTFLTRARDDATIPWYYDKDAGYITFYGANKAANLLKNPIMTFWRYEGGFGFGSSGSGGTGATGAQGPQGIQGPAGPPGSGGGGGGGTYANDTWLISNLLGQPAGITFGTPVSKSTAIYIPWSYPNQVQVGWAANQWLPNITKFTGSIVSGITGATGASFPVVSDATSADWIKDNSNINSHPATMLAIQKNSTANAVVTLSSDPTGPQGNTNTRYAYNYYNSALATALTSNTVNMLTAYYSNPSTISAPNSSVVSFNPFSSGGKPGAPLFITATSGGIANISAQWDTTAAPDLENPGEGSITSYSIKYQTAGSTTRYGGPIGQTGTTSSTTSPVTLNSLYPDAPYDIYVAAVNDSSKMGDYTGLTGPVSTNPLPAPSSPSAIVLDQTNAVATTSTIYKVSDQTTPIVYPLYTAATISTNSFEAPIHRLANRGLLQGANTIMTLSAVLDDIVGPDFEFSGFPAPLTTPTPVVSAENSIEISTTGVIDNTPVSDPSFKKGFYLKAAGVKIAIPTSEIVPGNTVHSIKAKQVFEVGSEAVYTAANFYYDSAPASPTCTLSGTNTVVSATGLQKVSGISVLTTSSTINIAAAETTNMGTYFYRKPLVSYFVNAATTAVKNEENLANATGHASGIITDGSLRFTSSFTCPVNTYGSTITLGMVANNILGSSAKNTKIVNAVTDLPSYTLAYTTLAQSVPTLTTNSGVGVLTAGHRILSSATTTLPSSHTSYDNTALITSSPYTTELLIANGTFLTPTGNTYYTSYNSSLNNSGVDYGSGLIAASGFRFASFCWKFPASAKAYKTLSFTINSILTPTNTGNLLQMNGEQLQIFYAITDPVNTSYAEGTMNTVWINANSNDNPASSGNCWNSAQNALLGGSASPGVTLSGNNATVNAFIPLVSPVTVNTMLYLRIAVPMNRNIQFGAVYATVGGNV